MMDFSFLLISAALLAVNEILLDDNQSVGKDSFMEKSIQSARLELAKSFSRKERVSSRLMNVSTTGPWTKEVGYDGARSFWAFKQTLILADNSIHALEDTNDGALKLRLVGKLPEFPQEDGLVFIEAVEWRRILFVLVAFKSDYCKIYTATPSMKITQRQTIINLGPKDGEFFTLGNDLFLAVVSSKPDHPNVPSTIYRWTGTHFDEIQTFMTSGAVAVSTFPFKGTVVIAVAQYPNEKPAIGSQVFRWSHNKLERLQYLATNGPVALQFLQLYGESYLLVINDFEYSSLFWWTGREFISWDSLHDVTGMRKISIGYTQEETLIFLARQEKIQVYRLMENRLHRLTTISLFDGEEVISMSLHPSENPTLVAISRKDGVLSTSVFHLQIIKGPYGDSKQIMDPLLNCLLSLGNKLLARDEMVSNLSKELPKVLSVNGDMKLMGKLVVDGTVSIKNGHIKTIQSSEYGEKLQNTATQINQKVGVLEGLAVQTMEALSQLVKKSHPGEIRGVLHIKGDLMMDRASIEELNVTKINGNMFDYSNMLSYSLDQVITGPVSLFNLATNDIKCSSINGIHLGDLLLNQGNQEISGYHKVVELSVSSLQILHKSTINDINLKSLVTKENNVVKGVKLFESLDVDDLVISFFQNENVANIKEMMVHKAGGQYLLEKLMFQSNLEIVALQVTEINGIQWDEFVSAVFVKGLNQVINGDLEFGDLLSAQDLSTDIINKIHMWELMTCTTPQEISSAIYVDEIVVKDIQTTLCNGIDVSKDIGRIGVINNVDGNVYMSEVKTQTVTTDRETIWEGVKKPSGIKHTLIYDGHVKIAGNMQVDDAELKGCTVIINGSYFDITSIRETYLMAHQERIAVQSILANNALRIVGDINVGKLNGLEMKNIIHVNFSKNLHSINFQDVNVKHFTVKESTTVGGIDIGDLFRSTVMNRGDYLVKGHKNFVGGIVSETLQTHWINGDDMTHLVPLDGQVLNLGSKTINKMYIGGNLTARNGCQIGYLNEYNLTSVVSSAIRIDQPFKIDTIRLSSVSAHNVRASVVNNVNFNSFVKSLSSKVSEIRIKEVNVTGEIEFSGPLTVKMLNGIELDSYLCDVVNKKMGGNISGRKKFLGEVIIRDGLDSKTLNGIDMISLKEYYFSKTTDQSVTGYFVMKALEADALDVRVINGREMNCLFVNKIDQVIHSDVKFADLSLDADIEVMKLNNCSISQVGSFLNGVLEVKHIDNLNVSGQFKWRTQREDENSLSHLFAKAVNKESENLVDGPVIFLDDVHARLLITPGQINEISIKYYANDCVLKSANEQEIRGQKIFMSFLNTSRAHVINNANIKWINELNIPDTNQTLVRKSENVVVEGLKTFNSGFTATKMQCGGKVKGVSVANIVTTDNSELPPVEVQNLFVSENLNFDIVNSIDICRLLAERITCRGNQEIYSSLSFSEDLQLLGNTEVSTINNVSLQDIMLLDAEWAQEVSGKKTFQQTIHVKGNVDIEFVNDHSLRKAYEYGILANEDVEINGNVVFSNGAVMNADLSPKSLANGIDLYDEYKKASDVFEANYGIEKMFCAKLQYQVAESREFSGELASDFMYLEHANGVTQSQNWTSAKRWNDKEMSIFGMEINNCNLPKGCLCPRQYNIRVIGDKFTLMPEDDSYTRSFRTYDHNTKKGAEVLSHTISRSNDCRQPLDNVKSEFNTVVWMIFDDDSNELIKDSNMAAFTFEGYVSDVQSFSLEDNFFLVVAVYYNPLESSHNINSLILKWTTGETEASVVQKIPSFGAKVLDLFHTESGIHLFIGNSYDSDWRTTNVNDEIYRFNEEMEQFILLRTVPTTGTQSVKSLIINGDVFIVKSQDFRGPVVIYKYNDAYDNFYFYQNLHFNGTAIGVEVFYIGGDRKADGYVGVIVKNDSFHVYKYNHIEGFKRVWNHRQKGAQNMEIFTIGIEDFIFTSSLEGVEIMRVVKQGS